MTSLSEFHCFPNLPAEIRLAIWRLSIPRRIHDSDGTGWSLGQFLARNVLSCRCGWRPTQTPYALPILSQVCCESRAEVLRHGYHTDIIKPWKAPRRKTLDEGERRGVTWFQPQLDTIFLNSPNSTGHLAKDDGSGCGFCIPSDIFLPRRRTPDAMRALVFFSPKDIGRLEGRPAYDVIIGTMNIHAPHRDTPIDLIDPGEISSIRALHAQIVSNTGGQSHPYFQTLENIVHKADFRKLSRNMQILRDSITKVWVWCCWKRDRSGSASLDFDQVWARKRQQRSFRLIPSTSTASISLSPPAADWWHRELRGRAPNPEDPWVAQILATMPVFRPKLLVSYCQNK